LARYLLAIDDFTIRNQNEQQSASYHKTNHTERM